jgi:hypothetical protein
VAFQLANQSLENSRYILLTRGIGGGGKIIACELSGYILFLRDEFEEDDVIKDIGHLAQLGGEAVCDPEEEGIDHPHVVPIGYNHLPDTAERCSYPLPIHSRLTQRAHHEEQGVCEQGAAVLALLMASLLP